MIGLYVVLYLAVGFVITLAVIKYEKSREDGVTYLMATVLWPVIILYWIMDNFQNYDPLKKFYEKMAGVK